MTSQLFLTYDDVLQAANDVDLPDASLETMQAPVWIYGIPRGGVIPAYCVAQALNERQIEAYVTFDLDRASLIVDDIYDSGATSARYRASHPKIPQAWLFDKRADRWHGKWLVMPWEDQTTGGPEDAVTRLLQFVGEEPAREGLRDTPARVLRAMQEYTSGYAQEPASVLRVFKDGAEHYDEMILVGPISFYSLCEHHMAPFFGHAYVGYIPNGAIVGLSKLARLTHIFARRLQVQERMTQQIAQALHDNLQPLGVGVVVRARHMCMESRGIRQPGSVTTTSALVGVLRDKPEARAEFFSLIPHDATV